MHAPILRACICLTGPPSQTNFLLNADHLLTPVQAINFVSAYNQVTADRFPYVDSTIPRPCNLALLNATRPGQGVQMSGGGAILVLPRYSENALKKVCHLMI